MRSPTEYPRLGRLATFLSLAALAGLIAFAPGCDDSPADDGQAQFDPFAEEVPPVTPPPILTPAAAAASGDPAERPLDALLDIVRDYPRDRAPYMGAFLDERRLYAELDGDTLVVTMGLYGARDAATNGTLRVALQHVDGEVVDAADVGFSAQGYTPVTARLSGLPDDLEVADLAAYVITYQLDATGWDTAPTGLKSAFEALRKLELQVLTAERWAAGQTAFVRVFARDPVSGAPAADAAVDIFLEDEAGERVHLGTELTDALGSLGAELPLPPGYEGEAKLVVEVASELATDRAEADVAVLPDARILLTTDKPLYQPSQTMHLRALALDRASKQPMENAEVIFEVADAAGNKVFKERQFANSFGIVATTFRLARQVNMGPFRIKATLGDAEVEKEVTVERYVLPKFKVVATLDKPYYLPGETVHGTVSAQYFFGQPVVGGQVGVSASVFDVGFNEFAALSGFTNAEGIWTFEFEMPAYVAGSSLEQGAGMVKIDVTVTDGADHEQTVSKSTAVAAADVTATLVPESGDLVEGVVNHVYVVVSDPMGGPVQAPISVAAGGEVFEVEIDEDGLGVFALAPVELPLDAVVTITPAEGDPVVQPVTLTGGGVGRTILVRTDRAVYQVGDTVEVGVLMPQSSARVFLDVIHGGRTVATEALTVEDGFAHWYFEADGSLTGALQVHAYFLGADSEIVRDERLIYVDPADDLKVRLTPDQEMYGPGDPAVVDVEVTDGAGNPKAAALGVQVVDEAVFALQEMQPGLLKIYFELEEALSTPQYQFAWPDLTPSGIIEDPEYDGGEDDVRGSVAFAAQAGGAPAYTVDENTHLKRIEGVRKVLKPLIEGARDELAEEAREAFRAGDFDRDSIREWVETHFAAIDFWGRPYRFVEIPLEEEETWWWGDSLVIWEMRSDGPDELPGTKDDLAVEIDSYLIMWGYSHDDEGMWMVDEDMDGGGPPMAGGGGDPNDAGDPRAEGEDGGSGIRIRSYFPETLHVDPAVITDGAGQARIELTMADSITSWRMSALANSADGMLGSTDQGIIVFQDFFVDIDFPATLTRGDTISVPVAIYNYLDIPQTVTLTAQDADWIEFVDGGSVTVPLDPGEVDAIYFDVQVTAVGTHALTVIAEGTAMSDGVRRSVLVEPDGKEFTETLSARFHTEAPADQAVAETVRKTIVIPADNIDNAQSLLVKVYPGFFSQAVEGLDSMLRLPGG